MQGILFLRPGWVSFENEHAEAFPSQVTFSFFEFEFFFLRGNETGCRHTVNYEKSLSNYPIIFFFQSFFTVGFS